MINLEVCNNLFYDPAYFNYFVNYSGDLLAEIAAIDYACAYAINDAFAIVAVKVDRLPEFLNVVPSVKYVDKIDPFTLQENFTSDSYVFEDSAITPIEAAQIGKVQNNPSIDVTGENVFIGVIDTGIDYLNEAFLHPDGTTRIHSIWDQSIQTTTSDGVPFGVVYTKEQINAAINLKNNGGDPYTIVPSKDEIKHGTRMTGIMAASGRGGKFKGIAPECELVVIKLKRYGYYEDFFRKAAGTSIPLYAAADIAVALDYLYKIFLQNIYPMIIFLGSGTNFGSHTGLSLMAIFINLLTVSDNFIIVCGTGNEGNSGTHTTGFITSVGSQGRGIIELQVENIRNLVFQIWLKYPNKALLGVSSPSGESLEIANPTATNQVVIDFSYENTNLLIRYFYPFDLGGGELIQIEMYNLQTGIWSFYLTGEYLTDGRYDAWLPQRRVIGEGTEFGSVSQFTTLTIPSLGKSVVSVAYYNQTNDTTVADSGRGFNIGGTGSPLIAAGGINQPTVDVGGGIAVVSGSSVATAVVAGGCALFLEWAVRGYKGNLNVQSLKGILAQTATRQKGTVYPIPTYGYGLFNLENMFKLVR